MKAKTYQNDLGLVELLLHLHDRICLSRILILLQIRRRFWEINRGRVSERRLRNFRREIIEQFSQKRKSRSDGVFVVADEHRCIGRVVSVFQADVAPRPGQYKLTNQLFGTSPIVHMCGISVLLYTLALSLRGSFGDCFGEKGHEFRHRSSLIERKRGQIRSGGKSCAGLGRRREDYRERVNLHGGRRGRMRMVVVSEYVRLSRGGVRCERPPRPMLGFLYSLVLLWAVIYAVNKRRREKPGRLPLPVYGTPRTHAVQYQVKLRPFHLTVETTAFNQTHDKFAWTLLRNPALKDVLRSFYGFGAALCVIGMLGGVGMLVWTTWKLSYLLLVTPPAGDGLVKRDAVPTSPQSGGLPFYLIVSHGSYYLRPD